jgi:hypothetical protein
MLEKPSTYSHMRYEPLNALERISISASIGILIWLEVSQDFTQTHGFFRSPEAEIFYEWIGHTKEEFFQNVYKMGTDDKFEIEEKAVDPIR